MFGRILQAYQREAPFCVMARAILAHLLEPGRLDSLFDRAATRGYQKDLLFSQLTELMALVVLRHQPSALAAYKKLRHRLSVCDEAVYQKLARLEPSVSAALLADTADRAGLLIDAMGGGEPDWVPGYRCRILDGNHLDSSQRRIKELRQSWARGLPGRVLVLLDQRTGLATDAFPTEDGHASERSLLGDVAQAAGEGELWLADRNFCTLDFLEGLRRAKARFAIRQHGSIKGHDPTPDRPAGRCATGAVFEGSIRLRADPETMRVRRVTVELDKPTRDGDERIHILTDLPESKVTAVEVADLYRKRWAIEELFLRMSRTLQAEPNTLGYPKAALFGFCLGLAAANACCVLEAAVRAERGRAEADLLSAYYVALEIQQNYAGMMIALPEEVWAGHAGMAAAAMASWLREVAAGIDLGRYRKAIRGAKREPPRRGEYRNGAHVSTAKLLKQRKKSKR